MSINTSLALSRSADDRDALEQIKSIVERQELRFDRLESILSQHLQLQPMLREASVKQWYTTKEAAAILGKKPFTVREWCRLGRVHAKKSTQGRGGEGEWRISQQELERFASDGLLPLTEHQPLLSKY